MDINTTHDATTESCIKFAVVNIRPSSELIQSLRLTLQKLEENFVSVEDEPAMAELKRIVLSRIADLEALQALEAASHTKVSGGETPVEVVTEAAKPSSDVG